MKKKCFILSVVIHVLFIYLFTTLKFSHRPLIKETEAKEVVIVTPVKIFTPTSDHERTRKERFTGKRANHLITKKAEQKDKKTGAKKSEHPDRETLEKKETNPERRIVKILESDPDDAGLSIGAEDKTGYTSPATAPRFSLNSNAMRRIIGSGGNRKGIFTEYPGLTSAGRSSLSQVKGCNILPWARRVLRKVKQNWAIPTAAELGAKGLVGVSITVERDGRMSSITIRQSSQDDLLDKAAIAAFAASDPLPHLPDDFPYRDLHAYFLFNYNDRDITSPIRKSNK